MYYLLNEEKLKKLVSDLIADKGYKIVCQSKENKKYQEIKSAEHFYLNPDLSPSNVSIKEYFFPKTETSVCILNRHRRH